MAKLLSDRWLSAICVSVAAIAACYIVTACIVVIECRTPPSVFECDYVPFAIIAILASIGILDCVAPHTNDRKPTLHFFLKKPPP